MSISAGFYNKNSISISTGFYDKLSEDHKSLVRKLADVDVNDRIPGTRDFEWKNRLMADAIKAMKKPDYHSMRPVVAVSKSNVAREKLKQKLLLRKFLEAVEKNSKEVEVELTEEEKKEIVREQTLRGIDHETNIENCAREFVVLYALIKSTC